MVIQSSFSVLNDLDLQSYGDFLIQESFLPESQRTTPAWKVDVMIEQVASQFLGEKPLGFIAQKPETVFVGEYAVSSLFGDDPLPEYVHVSVPKPFKKRVIQEQAIVPERSRSVGVDVGSTKTLGSEIDGVRLAGSLSEPPTIFQGFKPLNGAVELFNRRFVWERSHMNPHEYKPLPKAPSPLKGVTGIETPI